MDSPSRRESLVEPRVQRTVFASYHGHTLSGFVYHNTGYGVLVPYRHATVYSMLRCALVKFHDTGRTPSSSLPSFLYAAGDRSIAFMSQPTQRSATVTVTRIPFADAPNAGQFSLLVRLRGLQGRLHVTTIVRPHAGLLHARTGY